MRILYLAILAIASLAHAQEAPSHFLIEYDTVHEMGKATS